MIEKRFIGMDECSVYLDVKKNTLYQWVHQRRIPHLKFGRRVKFDLRELEGWIKKNRVKPMEMWWKDE